MKFEKGKSGNPVKQFSKENQPTAEAKWNGRRAAAAMRASMAALLGSREPDDKLAAKVMEAMPGKKRDEVTHQDVLNLRQMHEAKNGSVKAYTNVAKVVGAMSERHEIEASEGMVLHIETASDKGRDNINKIMEGE